MDIELTRKIKKLLVEEPDGTLELKEIDDILYEDCAASEIYVDDLLRGMEACEGVIREGSTIKWLGPLRPVCYDLGDGWAPIVDIAVASMRVVASCTQVDLGFQCIKEKYGSLRIYWMIDTDNCTVDGEVVYKILTDIVEAAADTCDHTCEKCGEPGTRTSHGGWLAIQCQTCSDRTAVNDG